MASIKDSPKAELRQSWSRKNKQGTQHGAEMDPGCEVVYRPC